MSFYTDHARIFSRTVAETLHIMLGISSIVNAEVIDTESPASERNFHVAIYFTGMVYGEYIISMDESLALDLLGLTGDSKGVQEELCDAFAELLNTAVGESIVHLSETYKKLTFASPRVTFGKSIFPRVSSSLTYVKTSKGDIECHFYLDTMRLDLATSYDEVVGALVQSNRTLEIANQRLREHQAQLIQAEKMASLGTLAAGVAHEINNPLAFVDSNIKTLDGYVDTLISLFAIYESLANSLGDDILTNTVEKNYDIQNKLKVIGEIDRTEDLQFVIKDTKELLVESKDGLNRIREIVSGLKDFSHIDQGERVPTQINDVIEKSLALVWNQIKFNCEVETSLSDVPLLNASPGELGQVVINLLVNASQAMSGPGRIKISTEAKNGFILLAVQDNGSGIDPSIIKNIFNPFFTTKDVGKGTGLGLSISHGIIEKHGGTMSVQSMLGKGSRFVIRLPLVCAKE